MSHPERIVPDETPAGVLAVHLRRYEFARTYSTNQRVLDAACGVGYGAAHLAAVATEVVGVDMDKDALDYAQHRYLRPNLTFAQMNVVELDLPDDSFDVVVSFETIEHVDDGAAAVSEAARVLRSNGVYIVSTPKVDTTTTQPENPFHATEYSVDDFRTLLQTRFTTIEIYGQYRVVTPTHQLLRRLDVLGLRRWLPLGWTHAVTGSRAAPDLHLDDVSIGPSLEGATELIAVCRHPAA
jgi:2-polyprenyl-3-methyl-5-hydroxy-6-metoxy-1,4-benzoquinol methylase